MVYLDANIHYTVEYDGQLTWWAGEGSEPSVYTVEKDVYGEEIPGDELSGGGHTEYYYDLTIDFDGEHSPQRLGEQDWVNKVEDDVTSKAQVPVPDIKKPNPHYFKLRLIKENEDGVGLRNAEFTMIYTVRNEKGEAFSQHVYDTNREARLYTNSEGVIELPETAIKPGYTIEAYFVETKAPSNYKYDTKGKIAIIHIGGDEDNPIVERIEYGDKDSNDKAIITGNGTGNVKINNANSTKIVEITVKDKKIPIIHHDNDGGGDNDHGDDDDDDDDDDTYNLELTKISKETINDKEQRNTLDGIQFKVEIDKGNDGSIDLTRTITTQNGGSAFVSGLGLSKALQEEIVSVKITEVSTLAQYEPLHGDITITYTVKRYGNQLKIENMNITNVNEQDKDKVEINTNGDDNLNAKLTINNSKIGIGTSLRMNLGGIVFTNPAGGKGTEVSDAVYLPLKELDQNKLDELNNELELYTSLLNEIYEAQSLFENTNITNITKLEDFESLIMKNENTEEDNYGLRKMRKQLNDIINNSKYSSDVNDSNNTAISNIKLVIEKINEIEEEESLVLKKDILSSDVMVNVESLETQLRIKIDESIDKFSLLQDDGKTPINSTIVGNVMVELYKVKNEKEELIDTTYSENGNYTFYQLPIMENTDSVNYYTKFVYDGQEYQAYPQNLIPDYNTAEWQVTSKAKEEDRAGYNAQFSEIGSYPANYKVMGGKLFDGVDYGTVVNDEFWNQVWTQDDMVDIKEALVKVRRDNTKMTEIDAYKAVLSQFSNDPIVASKLQFLYNTDIRATTKYEVNGENINSKLETGVYPVFKDYKVDYEPIKPDGTNYIYPGQYFINLGLTKRPTFDMEISSKILASVDIEVNGKKESYSFGSSNLTKYLETRLADAQAGMNIKLNYIVTIKNDSNVLGTVTELVDYIGGNGMYALNIDSVEIQTKGYNNDERYKIPQTNIKLDNSIKYPGTEQNITGYRANYIQLPEEIKLESQQKLDVFMTFDITQAGIDRLKQLTDKNNAENALETDNIVEINGYKNDDCLLDIDSIPGNLADQINKKEVSATNLAGWEDDGKFARFANIYQAPRTLTGNVWEAANGVGADGTLPTYDGSKGIKGIDVELIELNKQEDGTLKEEIAQLFPEEWNESEQKWQIPSNAEKDENGNVKLKPATTSTDENGNYNFIGYRPGDYVIKFRYGNKTYSIKAEQNNEQNNSIPKIYSGEEYQSVKANKNTQNTLNTSGGIIDYWYNKDKDTRYSDAYDEVKSRQKAIDYLETYTFDKASLINSNDKVEERVNDRTYQYAVTSGEYLNNAEAKNALTIESYTAPLKLEVEYATEKSKGTTSKELDLKNKQQLTEKEKETLAKCDRTYEVKNIDFGITKRPENRIKIEKIIKDVTITLQNGEVLIDHATPGNIEEQLVKYAKKLPGEDLYFEIDDEILHGSKLEVSYDVKVTNEGDQSTLTYFYGKDGTKLAIGYYEEKYDDLIYKDTTENTSKQKVEGIGYHSEGKYEVKEYDKEKTETLPVTTRVADIVDYVESNYTFDTTLTEENKTWSGVTLDTLLGRTAGSEKLVGFATAEETLQRYQTILKTKNGNKVSTSVLIPDSSQFKGKEYEFSYTDEDGTLQHYKGKYSSTETTTINLSKVLTPTEDLDFGNKVEVVKIVNSAGRIDHTSTPGNYDPTDPNGPKEPDEAKAKIVTITDPTGQDNSNMWIAVTVGAIGLLAVGIVLIKKYAIDPRK